MLKNDEKEEKRMVEKRFATEARANIELLIRGTEMTLQSLRDTLKAKVYVAGLVDEFVDENNIDVSKVMVWAGTNVEVDFTYLPNATDVAHNFLTFLLDRIGVKEAKRHFEPFRAEVTWSYEVVWSNVTILITPAHPDKRCRPRKELVEGHRWVCEYEER
ncbi:MAG: hypothetical protein QXQ53_01300 [Candidatus Methanosuratincola sp.]